MNQKMFIGASIALLVAVSFAAVRSTPRPTIASAQESIAAPESASYQGVLIPGSVYSENAVLIRCNLCGLQGGPTLMSKHVCPSKAEIASAWSLSTTEKIALGGIGSRVEALRAEIDRISSGNERLAQEIVNVALGLRSVDADEREIAKDAAASRKLDVAVVQSTVGWLPVKK